MSLFNLNVEKSKRSLEVKKEVIEMIREKFDMSVDDCFNDLYKVKGGVVRRLKCYMSRVDYGIMDMKEYNKVFDEVKEFIDNLDIEGFDIKLNKSVDFGWFDYYRRKENGFEGTFEDYKNELIFNEETLILKIKWNV